MTQPTPLQLQQQAKLKALLEAFKNKGTVAPKLEASSVPLAPAPAIPESNDAITANIFSHATDKFGNTIQYNEKQQEFIDLVLSGKSCILIGAAGTGKTTCIKGALLALEQSGKLPQMGSHSHKYLPSGHAFGVSISAYTRRATNNIRLNLSEDLKPHAVTIHKLLEYEPVFYEVENPDTGKITNTMRFEPTRNSYNPQPRNLSTVVLEEASMIAVELFREVESSNPQSPQYIFLGDIQQLPPVFGSAILGYKMLELPTIELTEVYRQALGSPIIRLAHRILSGKPIPGKEFPEWFEEGKLKIHAWKKKIAVEPATLTLAKFFIQALHKGHYNYETDAILIPFNKGCGSIELNKHIANTIAHNAKRPVYEIVHGFRKSYYSIGDKCLYDKEDAIIENIYANPEYTGVLPKQHSPELNYWGHYAETAESKLIEEQGGTDDIDFMLGQVSIGSGEDGEDRVRSASHCIVLRLLDTERTVIVKAAGELNNLDLGYAITVHKSQGSEWEKVFFCLHNSHATMIQRELLYTAVTRAKKELFIICEEDSFEKGIERQRIKGNTLAEKAEYFKGKLENGDLQS